MKRRLLPLLLVLAACEQPTFYTLAGVEVYDPQGLLDLGEIARAEQLAIEAFHYPYDAECFAETWVEVGPISAEELKACKTNCTGYTKGEFVKIDSEVKPCLYDYIYAHEMLHRLSLCSARGGDDDHAEPTLWGSEGPLPQLYCQE